MKILGYKMHPKITTDLQLKSKLSLKKHYALIIMEKIWYLAGWASHDYIGNFQPV